MNTASSEGANPSIIDWNNPTIKVQLGKDTPKDSYGVPQFNAEFNGPCGWQKVQSNTFKSPKGYLFVRPQARTMRMWYDNREMNASQISVGRFEFPVASNTSGKVALVVEGCDQPLEVRVNGKKAGVIDVADFRKEAIVLDLSGKHCYSRQHLEYADMHSAAGSSARRTEPATMLHILDWSIDLFLQSAPAEIRSFARAESRNVWKDAPCS